MEHHTEHTLQGVFRWSRLISRPRAHRCRLTQVTERNDAMTTWTTVSDPAAGAALLPTWLAGRMMAAGGRAGSFGLLLATGDVLRVTSLAAAHLSSGGTVLLDVVLDHAGVPEGADTAWRSKHYLGAPVPAATRAMVNLAQVVAVVEFGTAHDATRPGEAAAEAEANVSATVVELRQAAEEAVERSARADSPPTN